MVSRAVVGDAVGAIGFAHLRTRVDGRLGRAVQRLPVDGLGAGDARIAPVKQRQLEVDLVATLRRLEVRAVAHRAEFEHVDPARHAREAQAPRGLRGLQTRGLHIEPLAERGAFDVGRIGRWRGQIGQAVGQAEGRLLAPQAHQADELFAAGELLALGTRDGLCGIGIEALFAQLLQLVEVACRGHAARQLGAGVGGLLHLARVALALLRGHRQVVGLARVDGEPEHAHHRLLLGLLEASRLDLAHPGQRQQVRQADAEAAFDLDLIAAAQAAEAEAGVGQPRRLHELGFGDADLGQIGLQAALVQQRHLHGGIGGQRLGEQLGDAALHGFLIGRRARHGDVPAEAVLHRLLNARHAAIGAERGAAAQQQGRGDQREAIARTRTSKRRCVHGVAFERGLASAGAPAGWPAGAMGAGALTAGKAGAGRAASDSARGSARGPERSASCAASRA